MSSDIVLHDDDLELIGNARLARDTGQPETILLDTNRGEVWVGTDGMPGDLVLKDIDNEERIHLNCGGGVADQDHVRVFINEDGLIQLGGDGKDGDLVLTDEDKTSRLHLSAGEDGNFDPRNVRAFLDGREGVLVLGGNGEDGDLVLQDRENEARIHISTNDISPNSGPTRRIPVPNPTSDRGEKLRLIVDGADGKLTLGGGNRDGDVSIRDANSVPRVVLNGGTPRPTPNDFRLDRDTIPDTARVAADGINGTMVIGGNDKRGLLLVRNAQDENTVEIDGDQGDLILAGDRSMLDALETIARLEKRVEELERRVSGGN